MIKKLAKKVSAFLLKFKKAKPNQIQDSVINSIIDTVVGDIEEVSIVADEALSKVVKTASEEAKKVESSIKAKGPKPAAKKDSSSTATNKPKGRPKKSSWYNLEKSSSYYVYGGDFFVYLLLYNLYLMWSL